MKLKNVQAYPIKDVPDHLTQECGELGKILMKTIEPFIREKQPNIILGAFTFLHASILKVLISDDPKELELAVKMAAIGLIKNMDFLIEIDKKNAEFKEDEK